jgi:ABC-2 type transport system ATP-binding protein
MRVPFLILAPSRAREETRCGPAALWEPNVELAIRTEHLTKIYGNRLIAVNDMNLEVPRGAIFGLLGPNGAGKTTTFRLLLGLQRASAGRAEVFGRPCGPNAVEVRRLIGYLPTHADLPGNLRPIEYLDLLGQMCRIRAGVRKPRLVSLLRAVGLLGITERSIGTLSTGETTRLGIAASLIADPPLLLWDEPTAGLDPAARRFTLDLIRELGKTHTIVVSTHILSDIDQVCDHVGVMHEGRIIFSGPMRDMTRRLERGDFILELAGEESEIQRLAAQVGSLEGVSAQAGNGQTLAVRVLGERSRAGTLAEVLKVVDGAAVTLLAIQSGLNQTENAYLQLLQEDEAHGFQRFDLDVRHSDHAAGGDPPA